MANGLYDKGREAFLGGDIDWDADNIKIALIDTDNYTVNLSTHQYMNHDTVASGAKVKISGNLSSKTKVAGVADAADEVLAAVSGATCEAVIVFKDGGDGGTSQSGVLDLLIAYFDTFDSGMPVSPNGGDITISWNASGIFKL